MPTPYHARWTALRGVVVAIPHGGRSAAVHPAPVPRYPGGVNDGHRTTAQLAIPALVGMIALLLGSCARAGFGAVDDLGRDGVGRTGDASGTGAVDGASGGDLRARNSCLPWPGKPRFGPIARLDELNSPARDIEPFVTPDGLTIYLSSARSGGAGGFDVYRATRPSRAARFGTPVLLRSINSSAQETRFALSRDRLTAYLASTRSGAGSKGRSDLWVVTRRNVGTPFSAADLRPLPLLNSTNDEWDPFPTADGLALYYEMVGFDAGQGSSIVFSTRSAVGAAWQPPRAAKRLNSPSSEGNASLTDDQLVVIFNSTRAGSQGGSSDIYFSTRASKDAPWSAPKPLADLNTSSTDNEPFISGDGCAIYFTSTRPGGKGREDIYRALLAR